jgi:hypothetical protein
MTRGPSISSLTGLLATFNPRWNEQFHKSAGNQARTAYDSIINNRHLFVHEAACNVTFGDLERWFNDSRDIFFALVSVLGLKASEIARLH